MNAIKNLDQHEKAVLREYYIQGKSTLKIPMDNPTVSGLIDKQILYLVGQYGEKSSEGMLFNFAINEKAREYLTYQILELPTGESSERDFERIRVSRPQWTK